MLLMVNGDEASCVNIKTILTAAGDWWRLITVLTFHAWTRTGLGRYPRNDVVDQYGLTDLINKKADAAMNE
jgi:hypothetical protein